MFWKKDSKRLAMLGVAALLLAAAFLGCDLQDQPLTPSHPSLDVTDSGSTGGGSPADTVFEESFESGTLNAWQDGVNPSLHQVVTDSSLAHSGSHVLEVTYPAGSDGGWLTHFLMPGYDSLYLSAWVRFPPTWVGGTKLLSFYGSRTDNQWSAFGQAGKCPSGTDFFAAMVVTENGANPGPTRFYSYYPAMARESDGVTCWGRFGDGTEQYVEPLAMSSGSWHRVDFWVKLNTPGQQDAAQAFWVDGVQRGSWNGLSFRASTILELNSVQLTFSNSESTVQTQKLYVDDIIVSTHGPGEVPPPPPPPPPPAPAPVASVVVAPTGASIAVGSVQQLSATLRDSSGNVLTGRAVSWASSNTAVATVSGSGLVTGVAVGFATITATSEGVTDTATMSVSPAPAQVTDLAVSSVQDTVVTLSFREVSDGTGQPAKYEIRYATGTMQWGDAVTVTQGTCAAPVLANRIGFKRSCKVYGLNPSTAYRFQMVAFRGTYGVDAVFGPRSNIVSKTTKRAAVASVTVGPATTSIAAASTQQFTATVKDNRGNILTGRTVTWVSSDPGIATVGSGGLATAKIAGSATVTATSETVRGTAAITVTPAAAVASVTVGPASVSVALGSTQLLAATLRDAAGNILAGRPVTWSSSDPVMASVGVTGLVTGLLAGNATISASAEGQTGTAQVSVTSSWGGTPVTNEPAGWRMLNDQPWNALTGNGWNYLRRTSTIDGSIVTDSTAPASPSSVLRIAYSAGCCNDAEPSVHWMSVPGVQEIYTSWWMKLSPNWIPNPAGGGKITFLWTNGVGQVYTNLYHQAGTAETGWTQGPPYRIGLNTEWSPYGQKIWLPNVATTGINPGEWHKIEVYYRWGTSGNGVIRWWVDGVLNGEYSNVSFPTSGTNFSQFEFAPTVQYAGSEDRYMYIDHTHVSVP